MPVADQLTEIQNLRALSLAPYVRLVVAGFF
jgi:hypothetical protein